MIFKMTPGALDRIKALPKLEAHIANRTKAVEEACTAESSWGGYASTVDTDSGTPVGRVWSYARQDGRGTTERAQRLIRNLDAE